ncbi:MAG: Nex18 symbiotically induced protein [Acidobacteria bacterium]|nr:MAG: Nex18 symbiotically induced protein [Acidobacteriota bacterium]
MTPENIPVTKPQCDCTAKKDIADTVASGNFKTLASALQAAGMVDTLKGKGPYTVFAPTDAAFAKLPAGTLEDLLKPENKEKLVSFLNHHVIAGKVKAKDVARMSEAKPLDGKELKITVEHGKALVGGAHLTKTNIQCNNGVIHAIDSVL